MKTILHAALLSGSTAVAIPAIAQEPGSRQTREFVQAAAQSDEFEIMEATTALAQSQNKKVKLFATRMIEAHRRTSENLAAAIAKSGLTPPDPGISGDQSMLLASLQSQRGADFDRVYLNQQSLAHHAALATEQLYATSGDNPFVRQIAATMVPVIIEHMRMVDELQR